MASPLILAHTVRHLRPRQVVNRVLRKIRPPRLDKSPAPPRRTCRSDVVPAFLVREVSFLGGGRFRFLNETHAVPAADYAVRKGSLLWDYNFHYFDGLHARRPSDEEKGLWVREWLESVPDGVLPAWDPYPTSRRILNWVKWLSTGSGVSAPSLVDHSLAVQTRWLSGSLEYHLMANHLLANAVALTAAGLYFGGSEGEEFLHKGIALLLAELDEQFLDDGGHFELSPVYHALILEDLLDVVQLARRVAIRLPGRIEECVRGAGQWLGIMTRTDGALPLFNDAAYGVAARSGPLLEYAERMELGVGPFKAPGLVLLPDSGYFRYNGDELQCLGDVGPIGPSYQPGHGHCDMLSFELMCRGAPVVVDTGTSTYERSPRRGVERGTAAHNTVQISDLEQSEIWASFRVGRRASILRREVGPASVTASIRAFPPLWAKHTRRWSFEGDEMTILDSVSDRDGRRVQGIARIHLHPNIEPRRTGSSWQAGGVQITFVDAHSVKLVPYEYAPEFNRRVGATAFEVEFRDELRTVMSA